MVAQHSRLAFRALILRLLRAGLGGVEEQFDTQATGVINTQSMPVSAHAAQMDDSAAVKGDEATVRRPFGLAVEALASDRCVRSQCAPPLSKKRWYLYRR